MTRSRKLKRKKEQARKRKLRYQRHVSSIIAAKQRRVEKLINYLAQEEQTQ
tara:strand:+ start:478 stop:630 length:153 start_codon:yes stop_codon:yes gene_type:complete